ncbi:MFS general substrate transporter [Lactarius indigo]|nr:MFS general substrate transporter [Lactarius indigo]
MLTGQFLLNAGGSQLHLAPDDSPAFPYQPLDEMGSAKQVTRPWSSYIWDSWNKSPEERKFLRRLDACLITYAALSYFSKYLDQQNVTNAYVSGMQEDLHLHGNQLNYITTSWTVGYVIGQIPSNMLITRIRPSIWIPAMELIWSSLTMCLALSKNFSTLCAIRFLVGLAESTFYPAIQYVIGSWYKKEELAKRSCIFHTASAVGPMVSGFLQAGVYNGLNNRGGVAGWKWLFIIDGVITIPIALLGFIIMPDLPTTTKPSIFYTQEQLDIAIKRMESEGRKPPGKLTKEKVRGFFSTWHIYALVPLYVLFNNGGGGSTSMIFWLKSFNKPGHIVYTIGQINTYPLGIYSLQIVTTLIYAWWSDAVVARWPPILFAGVNSEALTILLLLTLQRAFVVASCNMFAYVFQAWLPIVIFPQVQQPRVFLGNVTTACINFSMIIAALTTLSFQRRDQRRAATSEIRTPSGVTDDGHENIKSIDTKRRAEEGVP